MADRRPPEQPLAANRSSLNLRGDTMADPEHIRTILQLLFEDPGGDVANAHEIYHDDAVLEFPQSGERFEGVDTFTAWRGQYPADVTFRIRRIDRFRGFLPRRAVRGLRRGARDDGSADPGLPRRQGDSGADLCHRALGSPRVAGALALGDACGVRLAASAAPVGGAGSRSASGVSSAGSAGVMPSGRCHPREG